MSRFAVTCLSASILLMSTLPCFSEPKAVAPAAAKKKTVQPEYKAITKQIKRAIRDGFKEHDHQAYWSVFAPEASFVFGRRLKPGNRDYSLNRIAQSAYLKRMWSLPLTGHEDVYFREAETERRDKQLFVRLMVAFHFFGGTRLESHVYELSETKGAWKILAARVWPLYEAMGPDISEFDTAFWKTADAEAKLALETPSLSLKTRLQRLIRARWYKAAYKMVRSEVMKRPNEVEAWKAVASLGFLLGDMKTWPKAVRAARKIDPKVELPPALH